MQVHVLGYGMRNYNLVTGPLVAYEASTRNQTKQAFLWILELNVWKTKIISIFLSIFIFIFMSLKTSFLRFWVEIEIGS